MFLSLSSSPTPCLSLFKNKQNHQLHTREGCGRTAREKRQFLTHQFLTREQKASSLAVKTRGLTACVSPGFPEQKVNKCR